MNLEPALDWVLNQSPLVVVLIGMYYVLWRDRERLRETLVGRLESEQHEHKESLRAYHAVLEKNVETQARLVSLIDERIPQAMNFLKKLFKMELDPENLEDPELEKLREDAEDKTILAWQTDDLLQQKIKDREK